MSIPAYILCRDRLGCLKDLVAWLERFPVIDVVLMDSGSTYQPLLEWMERSPHRVVHMDGNGMGQKAMDTVKADNSLLYVFSDPDVVPYQYVPDNWIEHFVEGMNRWDAFKVGFSLDISALPKSYPYREDVYRIESPYWTRPIGDFFEASIDTTFALIRSDGYGRRTLRSNFPYVAQHTTWHLDLTSLPPDEQWYVDHAPVCAHFHGEKCTELGRMNRREDGGQLGATEWAKVCEVAYVASNGDYDWREECPTREEWLRSLPPKGLSELAAHYNTDKGLHGHGYTSSYEGIFRAFREKYATVVEIGISTGASLRMWRDYFPKALIIGIDNDPNTLFAEDRIVCCLGDQRDARLLQGITRDRSPDLVIDDGGHELDAQRASIEALWPMLTRGGYYVVEDVVPQHVEEVASWCADSYRIPSRHTEVGHAGRTAIVFRKDQP